MAAAMAATAARPAAAIRRPAARLWQAAAWSPGYARCCAADSDAREMRHDFQDIAGSGYGRCVGPAKAAAKQNGYSPANCPAFTEPGATGRPADDGRLRSESFDRRNRQ